MKLEYRNHIGFKEMENQVLNGGKSGYCYTYKKEDEASRKRAIAKAAKQGRAIKRSQEK